MVTPDSTPPPAGRPPWFPWVVGFGGGVAFAVALFLVVANLGSGGRAAAPTTTIPVGPTTTSLPAVTTTTAASPTTSVGEATTTTGPSTTTTTPPLLEDRFEGSSLATPLFAPEINTFDFLNGSGRLTAHSLGTLPVMYDLDVGDVRISFEARVNEGTEAGRYGAFILGEDPSDGVMEHWVGVWLDPGLSQVVIVTFADDRFGPSWLTEATGDAAFGFGEWIDVVVTYSGGTVTVELDGETAMVVDIEFDADHGYVGFGMFAGGSGDRIRVDDFVVGSLGG